MHVVLCLLSQHQYLQIRACPMYTVIVSSTSEMSPMLFHAMAHVVCVVKICCVKSFTSERKTSPKSFPH